MFDRPFYLVAIDNPDHRRLYLTLLANGEKGATPQRSMATRMTLPEAWNVLLHMDRTSHTIVPDIGQ